MILKSTDALSISHCSTSFQRRTGMIDISHKALSFVCGIYPEKLIFQYDKREASLKSFDSRDSSQQWIYAVDYIFNRTAPSLATSLIHCTITITSIVLLRNAIVKANQFDCDVFIKNQFYQHFRTCKGVKVLCIAALVISIKMEVTLLPSQV